MFCFFSIQSSSIKYQNFNALLSSHIYSTLICKIRFSTRYENLFIIVCSFSQIRFILKRFRQWQIKCKCQIELLRICIYMYKHAYDIHIVTYNLKFFLFELKFSTLDITQRNNKNPDIVSQIKIQKNLLSLDTKGVSHLFGLGKNTIYFVRMRQILS